MKMDKSISRMLFTTDSDDELDYGDLSCSPVSLLMMDEDDDSGLGMECLQISDAETDSKDSQNSLFTRPFAKVSEQSSRACKRPAPEDKMVDATNKRPRTKIPAFKRSFLFGDTPVVRHESSDVKEVVNRLVEESDLIADGSRSYCLPTIAGKHPDLKSTTSDTVADLLNGKYDDVIGSYRLIDCRYPYEYEGGHIKGATNIYKEEGIPEILERRPVNDNKRHILLFYCEFSSERGPKMYRNVRSADRALNKDRYPLLNFPEIYLIHNGYKNFYETHRELCVPDNYTPMLHKDHSSDLRHFRSKSKSWSGGFKRRNGGQRLVF